MKNKLSYIQLKRLCLAWFLSGVLFLNGSMFYSPVHASNLSTLSTQTCLDKTNTLNTASLNTYEAKSSTIQMEYVAEASRTMTVKTLSYVDNNNDIISTYEDEVVEINLVYNITEEERELLARLVELEAGNQTIEERAKVVQVVFNRVEDGRFGDGIEGVIFEDGQFEPAPKIPNTTPSESSYLAVDSILNGDIDLSDFNFLYFYGDGQLNHFYNVD